MRFVAGEGWKESTDHAHAGLGPNSMAIMIVHGIEGASSDLMDLWQKNHFEACYCLEGEGTVEELKIIVKINTNAPFFIFTLFNYVLIN